MASSSSSNNNNSNIVRAKDFDVSKVTFSDVKAFGGNGGKIVYLSYGRAPLVLQTPAMRAPFGVSKWENDGSPTKFTLDMSFQGIDSSKSMRAFFAALEKLDERMIDDGFENQATWFRGKRYGSKDIVEALYTPIIKHARDRETGERTDRYAPTIKVNIPFKDDAFACEVFDAERQKIDLRQVETKGGTVTAIVQCTGVWFVGGKYGISFKALQLKVDADEMSLGAGFALRMDGSDDGGGPREEVDVRERGGNAQDASSSEDDDDDDDASDYEEADVAFVEVAAPVIAATVSPDAPDEDGDVVATQPKKKVYKRVMRT